MPLRRNLYDENSIFRRKPDQRDEPHLEVNVVLDSAQEYRQNGAENREGHCGNRGEWQ